MTREEAIHVVKSNWPEGRYMLSEALQTLIPELKESEDERIKNLLYCLIRDRSDNGKLLEHNGVSVDKALAWLEKQGEQKPIEEVNGEDYGIDGLYHAVKILEETLGDVYGYQTDDGILEHECAINAVKELYEQKHFKRSEEDEKIAPKND